jgi:hypothetical protein
MTGVELFALPAAIGGGSVTLGTALAVGGAAFTALGAISSGNAAKAAGDYNAALYERNAQIAEQNAKVQEDRQRRLSAMRAGANRAAVGASGISLEGSPLDILESNAAQEELDALMIRWNGQNEATGLRASGALQRAQGANAQRQGYMTAGSAILLGAARAYDSVDATKPKLPKAPTISNPYGVQNRGGVSSSAYMSGYSGAG